MFAFLRKLLAEPNVETRREPESWRQAINELETRVEQMEIDRGERHIAVLAAMEKVQRQMNARIQRRIDRAEQDPEQPDGEPEEVFESRRRAAPSTAHLASRFRRSS